MAAEKILVVDDEPHIRLALQAALESDGYLVLTAENGREGVEKCKSFKPALAILDVRMPVMDGHMASIEIKYDDQLKDTKINFLTANTDDDSRNYGLGHGAEMYLNKPFQVDDLLSRVGSILRPAKEGGPATGPGAQAPAAPSAPVDSKARAAYLESLKKKLGGK